jgi:hypothetical protein
MDAFFDPLNIDEVPTLTPLKDIVTDAKRGIATGDNEFFCLSESDLKEWEIERDYVAPIIRSASRAHYYDYTTEDWEEQRDKGDEVYLLYNVDVWKPELQQDNVWNYIQHGIDEGADESYLASNRNPWYVVDRRDAPHILFKYMSRADGGRFVYNEAGALNLNNLHGITLREEFPDADVRALLAYLNSSLGDSIVKRNGRTYMGGLSKGEPDELKRLPVLNPRKLSTEQRDRLAGLFTELCRASRQEDDDAVSNVLDEIDKTLGEFLNLD